MEHICVARGRVEGQESGRRRCLSIVGVPFDAAGGPSPRNPEGRAALAPVVVAGRLRCSSIAARPAPSPGLKAAASQMCSIQKNPA